MAIVIKYPEHALNKVLGDGHCVRALQALSPEVPHTRYWRQGKLVAGDDDLPRGTCIATFDKKTGFYINDTKGRSHAAVYLHQGSQGLRVMDQWVGHPFSERTIRFKDQGPDADNGLCYHVLEVSHDAI